MKFKHILLILFLLSKTLFGQTSGSVTKEIPHYKNGHISVFYQATHFHLPILELDSLESGFDSLALRLWYQWAFERKEIMLQISRSPGEQWTGTLYKFPAYVPPEVREDSVIKTSVSPKSGWTKFIASIHSKQITTLSDPTNIKGYEDQWTDGWACSVEIATKEIYRFYNYHLPEKFQKEFWQAKNMVDILNLVQVEFGIKWNYD